MRSARQLQVGRREHQRVEVAVPEQQMAAGNQDPRDCGEEAVRVPQALDDVLTDRGGPNRRGIGVPLW